MKTATLSHNNKSGWSAEFPVELDSEQTLIIIFGSGNYIEEHYPIKILETKFPESKVVGCSTAGEILGDVIEDESLAVSIVKFEKTEIRTAISPVKGPEESFSAGEEIARLLNRPDLKGILILSDGLKVNGTELVAGLNAQIPENVVVTGGLAGDKTRFERTWVLKDGVPSESFISAVGFYGDNINIGHGSKDGMDIFGIERKVTKSEKNVLFELEGQPALELYKRYLGDEAANLPASALFFPLSLRTQNDEKRIVRTILQVDEKTQSMTFAGDIPQGSMVSLMRANPDRIIDGASQAAEHSVKNFNENKEILSIAISCVGRRLVLGERAEEELEAVLENFPGSTKQIGFYSYGEISPFETGYCHLLNQTMTLTTISEF